MAAAVQILNDVERAKTDIAAAQKREQEVLAQVQQAKHGKEDSVSTSSSRCHIRMRTIVHWIDPVSRWCLCSL